MLILGLSISTPSLYTLVTLKWLLLCSLIYQGAPADVLLSRNRKTSCSSCYNSQFTAVKATDGNYDGNMYHNSCFHSDGTNVSKWWFVILDAVSVINRVVIYSRTDQCTYRTQYLSFFASYDNQHRYSDESLEFYKVQYFHGPPPNTEHYTTVTFNRLIAKTVGVTKPIEAEAIQLCEFEVYGHGFKKTNSMIYYKYGPYALYENVTSIKKMSVRSSVECAIICMQTLNCVSWIILNTECLLYNHAGGTFSVREF